MSSSKKSGNITDFLKKEKNQNILIIAGMAVLIIVIAVVSYSESKANYLRKISDPIDLDETVEVKFNYATDGKDSASGDLIPVFEFIPDETAEYTLSVTDIKQEGNAFLIVSMMDSSYSDYINEDNAADGGDIRHSAIVKKRSRCYIAADAASDDPDIKDFSGSFSIRIEKTGDAFGAPAISTNESVTMTVEEDEQKYVRFTPEKNAYYHFTTNIVSRGDKKGNSSIVSIKNEDDKNVKQTQGLCYMKEGENYYIWVAAEDIKGTTADVEVHCDKVERVKASGNGKYTLNKSSIIEFTSLMTGNLAVYSVSDGYAAASAFDDKGFPFGQDKGSGAAFSGNTGDFAFVLQAGKNRNYRIFVEGVFSNCDIYIRRYTGDGRTLMPDDTGRLKSEVEADKAAIKEAEEAASDYGLNYLVLVNRTTALPDGWEEKVKLAGSVNSVGDEVQTEVAAYAAYLKLKYALENEKIHIQEDSAYRSVADQKKIFDEFTEKYGADYAAAYSAVPGYSEHHTGLAIDLYFILNGVTVYENEDLMKYPEVWAKIHEKLPEYGFILRYFEGNDAGYEYEPWHIRYVGSPEIAKEITERGITLENYLAEHPQEAADESQTEAEQAESGETGAPADNNAEQQTAEDNGETGQ